MMYGLETVDTTKIQEAELDVGEMKMLRFTLEVTRKGTVRNEYISQWAKWGSFADIRPSVPTT